ncbi:MAG: isochorismatase family protein [Dongiaceae bacterium]
MLIEHTKSQLLLIDLQARLVPVMAPGEDLVRQCGILIEAARELQVPVLASEQYPIGLGRTIPVLRDMLAVGEIYEKDEFSCLANAELQERLLRFDCQTIIAGIEAHVCVLQTAMALRAMGRPVYVVVDATASRRALSKQVALDRLAAAGAELVTTEMVVFEWLRRAGTPVFRKLIRLIR